MYRIVTGLIVLLFAASAAPLRADEIRLSAPPRLVERLGQHSMHEIASYLSVSLERSVWFANPSSSEEFVALSKADGYDLVIDEAHVSAWRIKQLNHEPLVQLTDAERSVVVSRVDHPEVFSVADLSGRVLCASSPSLAGLREFLGRWARPFAGPTLRVPGGDPEFDASCDAFIQSLSGFRARGFNPENRILTVTRSLPGITITGSPRLDPAFRQSVVRELLVNEGVGLIHDLFGIIGDNTPALAIRDSYGGLSRYVPPEYE